MNYTVHKNPFIFKPTWINSLHQHAFSVSLTCFSLNICLNSKSTFSNVRILRFQNQNQFYQAYIPHFTLVRLNVWVLNCWKGRISHSQMSLQVLRFWAFMFWCRYSKSSLTALHALWNKGSAICLSHQMSLLLLFGEQHQHHRLWFTFKQDTSRTSDCRRTAVVRS